MPTMRSNSPESALPELIDGVYSAALNPGDWADAVDRILRVVGGSSAMLYTPTVVFNQGGFIASKQIAVEHLTDYTLHCHPENDWFQAWARKGAPENVVVTGDMLLNRKIVHRSRLFNEFLKPLEMFDMCSAILHNGAGGRAPALFCTIFRGKTDRDFRPREVRLMQRLLPHLKRAVEMSRLLARTQEQRKVEFAVLQHLPVGVILLDARGAVVFANRKAESFVRMGDGLRVTGGRIHHAWQRESFALEGLISGTRLMDENATLNATPLALARPSFRPPFLVTAAPLPNSVPLGEGDRPPVTALFVTDSATQAPLTARSLMSTYDLTAAEANVAMRLIEGMAPKDIAESHHLRITTIRTHLARIYMKTGTTRQSDLVRKVLTEIGAPNPAAPVNRFAKLLAGAGD